MAKANDVGVVVIGRNDGERLVNCLTSDNACASCVIYVDWGSTGGSVEFATRIGTHAVGLDPNIPFTAARVRNEGFLALKSLFLDIRFVQFTDAILECRAANGFGTRAADVAASLWYTGGAMPSAAAAIRNGQVAVSPTSGFHHSGHSMVAGFCTFNGLMVSALALKGAGLAERAGVFDFDQHYGDGTDDIIESLGIDFVTHYSSGANYHFDSQRSEFLQLVPELVASMNDYGAVLYQAGADPRIDDPLGGWLTTEQLAERDRLVFGTARQLGILLAWCLAGGYQSPLRKVLDVHDNTMRECASAYLGDSVSRNQA